MSDLHQSRNLTVNQTLDEILGINRKTETVSHSNGNERNSLNSPIRPPTRHGRESVGSNEENKDPIHIEASSSNQTSSSSTSASNGNRRHSDDDFIKKLNDYRRRSLISDMSSSTSSAAPVNSIQFHPESPRSRPRLEIHVEESTEDVAPQQSFSESLSTNAEEPSLTFRVDKEEEEEKRPESGKKTKKKTVSDPPPPVPKTRERPPTSVSTVKNQDLMQASMFHSNINRNSDAHHKEWLQKKEKEIRDKKAKEKREAEQKQLTEKERRENSAKLYQRWVQDHDEKMKELKRSKTKKEKEKSEKEQSEKAQKTKEAEKNYEIWKRERSKSVTDIKKKLEDEAEKNRKNEEDKKAEKLKEAKAAFLAWKQKKEESRMEETKKLRKGENAREDELSRDFRLLCATEAYQTWLEMKEKEREMLADLVLIEAPPIPWIPPSNMVPRQFVRSAKGSRPKTRSQSAKSIAKRSRSRPATTTSLRPFRF